MRDFRNLRGSRFFKYGFFFHEIRGFFYLWILLPGFEIFISVIGKKPPLVWRLFSDFGSSRNFSNPYFDTLGEIEWATVTGVIGSDVDGVFPKYSQLNDVNSVSARGDRDLLATGDDFGLVKLFRFPASKRGAKFRKYNGHSAHVTNVTWTNDGQFLLSIGGADHGLFQWKLIDNEGMAWIWLFWKF